MPAGTRSTERSHPPIARIRRARRYEINNLIALISRAHAETYAPSPVDRAQYLAEASAKSDRGHRFWRTYRVAELDGRIVGVVQTVFDTVNALYVEADMRGRGIGSQLLSAAEAALRNKGVRRMRVRVADGFPRVTTFYERQGWHVAGDAEHYENEPKWGLRLLEMQKSLGQTDDARRQAALMIAKVALCAVTMAIIALSFAWTGAIGMTKETSVAVGAMLALIVGRFVLGLHSPHFGIRRTLFLGVAGTGVYLAVPFASIAVGWLCLQAAGLQEQAARDRTMMSIFVLCGLALFAERPARYAVARLWERYV